MKRRALLSICVVCLVGSAGLSCNGLLGPRCGLLFEVIDEKRSPAAGNEGSVTVYEQWEIGLDEVESAAIVPSPGLPNLALVFSEPVAERIGEVSVQYSGEHLSISRDGFRPLQLRMGTSLEGNSSFNVPVASEAHGRELLEMFTRPCE